MANYMLPNQVCAMLGISRETLLRWTAQGVLRAMRPAPMQWRMYDRTQVERLKTRMRKERRIGQSILATN